MSTSRHTARSLVVVAACLAMVLAAGPALAKRKASGCPGGRFAVTQGGELVGGSTVLELGSGTLAVEGACPAAGKVGKTGRKGTRVTVKWDQCGASEQVRLQATAARDCSGVRGKVRARGARRKAFVALPSACGDGIVDAGAGEECDGAHGCAEGDECAASCVCARAPEAMDCVVDGYPCTWGEVAPEVKAQSLALADAADEVLVGGGDVDDALAVIGAGNPASVESEAGTIRFRLPGGRPVWVVAPGSRIPAPAAAPAQLPGEGSGASLSTRLVPRSVVDSGRFPKSALLLGSLAWWENFPDTNPLVGGILAGVEDYAGNVASFVNASQGSRAVDLSTIAGMDGHNVVYWDTWGTWVWTIPTATRPGRKVATLIVRVIPKTGPDPIDDAQPGVDILAEHHQYWATVDADFFRHHYPHGLSDALVVLNAGRMAGSDIVGAMTGRRSNVATWHEDNSADSTAAIIAPFLQGLAAGRSVKEVHAAMGDGVIEKDVDPPASLVIGSQDIRIRDLVRVVDPVTLQPLHDGSLLTIRGYTDDELPDRLSLPVDLWGVAPDAGGSYVLRVWVDGELKIADTLDVLAQPTDGYRWYADLDVELGVDVHESQPLDIKVALQLPEGGTSVYQAVPLATGRGFSPGKKWQGHFTRSFNNGSFQIDMVVDATFERNPDQDPTSKYPKFVLTGGTLKWNLVDMGGDNCVHTAPQTFVELIDKADPNAPQSDPDSYLKFDLTAAPAEYYGIGRTEGVQVELTRTCPGSDPVVTHTTAGGGWFLAPSDEHYVAASAALSDGYTSASQLPSTHTWTLTKVE